MNRWHTIFLALLILGSGWLWYTRVPEQVAAAAPAAPAANHAAPDFSVRGLSGNEISLSSLKGKPVILNFWATWCGPCRREMPILQSTHERYGDDIHIVGLDQGEGAAQVRSFVDDFGVTFPIGLDEPMTVADRYNVMGLPTTVFIDSEGVIRRIYPGELNSGTLIDGIQLIMP